MKVPRASARESWGPQPAWEGEDRWTGQASWAESGGTEGWRCCSLGMTRDKHRTGAAGEEGDLGTLGQVVRGLKGHSEAG